MTNLSHLAPISKHFENGNCVKNNTDRLQKIKTIKSTKSPNNTNEKKICDEKTKNSSKLIAKIKELQLTESSQFADHLFLSHKRKLIQLVENETNLHSITCEDSDGGDLFFFIQMLKSQNLLTSTNPL
jgi:hypothetical protein